MRSLLSALPVAAALLLSSGCDPKGAGDVSFGEDSAADTGGDSTGPTGGEGQIFADDEPFFAMLVDGSSWSMSPTDEGNLGYFTTTSVFASEGDSSSAETVTIQIDGDLQVPGTYVVTYMSYTQQIAQETPTVREVDAPEGFTLTVQGYAETGYDERKYVYAESSGTAILSDGSVISDVQITNYPYIF